MTPQIAPLRITPEDLADLDKKTREGLQPLLDALNVFTKQTVAAMVTVPQMQLVDLTVTTGAVVADSFPILFRSVIARPRGVFLANIRPRDVDHVLTTPFVVQGFGVTDAGLISVPAITGLLIEQTYDLVFLVV